MSQGQILRLIVEASATVVWSANNWATTNKTEATSVSALNLWFADLRTEDRLDGSVIVFTFFWKDARHWEGKNYSVAVNGPKQSRAREK
jgi:glucoamylase